jgi:hypothetical protein
VRPKTCLISINSSMCKAGNFTPNLGPAEHSKAKGLGPTAGEKSSERAASCRVWWVLVRPTQTGHTNFDTPPVRI